MKRRFLLSAALLLSMGLSTTQAQMWPTGPDLPGDPGAAGTIGVTEYRGGFSADGMVNVVDILSQILSGDMDADIFTGQVPRADMTDPDTNVNGGPLGGAPIPFLSNEPGVDDNDIISVARGAVMIPTTGTYTFQVHSDDGFAFRFLDKPFSAESGNGDLDPDDGSLVHPGNTGDSNTRGSIDLTAGAHEFEFLFWERGGGAFWEISSAVGDYVGGGARWLALGDTSVLPDRTTGPVANLAGPLSIGTLDVVTSSSVEVARGELIDARDSNAFDWTSDDVTELVIDDQNTNLGCPFGDNPAFHDSDTVAQWPNSELGNVDNFGNLITGKFTVNDGDNVAGEELVLTFHVDVDDRSIVRIVGQDFIQVGSGNGFTDLVDIDGDDSMLSDAGVCNANYSGLIKLKEGVTYDLEVTHVENGGDAGIQVLVGLGDFVNNGFDGSAFFPITTSTDTVFFPGNSGLALVAPGGGVPGDFNKDGQLDAADIDALTMESAAKTNGASYDLNGDSKVDDGDITKWIKDLKNSWVGDANLDGEFNSSDLVTLFAAGTYENGSASKWTSGDFDGDGLFTTSDLVAALTDGGYEQGTRGAVSAVPEPTGLSLLVMGTLAALGLVRRR